jgi:hypothetical protein
MQMERRLIMDDQEIKNEVDLWHIIRMHNSEIKVSILFTADYGNVFYKVDLLVRVPRYMVYSFQGRNLYKRYAECIKKLTEIYGDNLYKYGTEPIEKTVKG